MLRIPLCLDNRLTDGYKVSLTRLPRFAPQKLYFSVSGTQFCKLQGLVRLEGVDQLKKFVQLIGSRARDLTTYSIAT
jgi:hypothetical protein